MIDLFDFIKTSETLNVKQIIAICKCFVKLISEKTQVFQVTSNYNNGMATSSLKPSLRVDLIYSVCC